MLLTSALREGLPEPPALWMERACVIVCLLIFVVVAAIHTVKRPYPDTAVFGGDTWEYQSVGVNIALGHGQRFGGAEPFEVYRFAPMSVDPSYKASFIRRGTLQESFHAYRTPGYPYFLALSYRIAGVHPAVVKRVQALMLILVGAFLPFLGLRFWGVLGFLGGIVAVPAFLLHNMRFAGDILTESLIVFTLFVLMLTHLRWSRRPSGASLFLLGLGVGWGLLLKGSLVCLPLIYLGYLLWSDSRGSWRTRATRALVFLGGVGIVVLPYSGFASIKSHQIVVLSTQGAQTLLDGNNEFAVQTGTWEPGWRGVPGSFFNRVDVVPLSPLGKVLRFYQADPRSLLWILPHKIDAAFGSVVWLGLYWVLISASTLALLVELPALAGRPPLAVGVTTAVAVAACAAIMFRRPPASGLLLLTVLLFWFASRFQPRLPRLPAPLLICFANFLLLTVVIFGHRRFTDVMEFLVILTAASVAVWCGFEAVRLVRGRPGRLNRLHIDGVRV